MNLSDVLDLTPQQTIGGITVQTTIEENYTDNLVATDHPVETGANITDHAYKLPAELILRCGWSNSNMDALTELAQSVISGGSLIGSDYVSAVYSQLLALQQSRQPFAVTTTRRQYSNMLITTLRMDVDQRTSNALMVQATLREIIIVGTHATTMPPQANQSSPASTAGTTNTGTNSPVMATPAPGGALPIGG